jgi:glycosyltransferase involved in cell wall biosynthesis
MLKIEEVIPENNLQIIGCNDRHSNGKGWAVREALKWAKGDYVILIDGDGDIEPRMIKRLMPFLEDYDIVVGKKEIRGLLSRRILTILSRAYISILFKLGVDTQTGIKIFKKEALCDWETNGYMFDLEILAKAQKKGFKIIEVPIEVDIKKRMKLKSVINCLRESLKIRFS